MTEKGFLSHQFEAYKHKDKEVLVEVPTILLLYSLYFYMNRC